MTPFSARKSAGPADPATAAAGAVTWVLDPIDGTVNFVYGIPSYAVSVAAQVDGVSVAGAVADVVGGRLYSAAAGLGAHVVDAEGTRRAAMQRRRRRCRWRWSAPDSPTPERRRAVQAALVSKLLPVVRDVRRIGSAALDLCMVAAGRLDAYYEHGLQRVGLRGRRADRRRGRRAGAVAGAGGPGGHCGPGGRRGARASPTSCWLRWNNSTAWPRFRADRSAVAGVDFRQ